MAVAWIGWILWELHFLHCLERNKKLKKLNTIIDYKINIISNKLLNCKDNESPGTTAPKMLDWNFTELRFKLTDDT